MPNKSVKIYGIKNCDTMKKSFQWLNDNQITYEFHDYKKLGIDAKTIESWLKKRSLSDLINSKGLTFKKLSTEQQEACKKKETAIPLMLQFTSMIKRPIIALDQELLLGFEPILWEQKLVNEN